MVMKVSFALQLLLLSIVSVNSSVKHDLAERMEGLRHFLTGRPKPVQCNETNLIVITEIPFGNSGNNVIEFTHGLWLSRTLNATFVVPSWIRHAVKPFNLSTLHEYFCFNEIDSFPPNARLIEVTSEDSFFLCKIFHDPTFNSSLPPYSHSLIEDVSEHFVEVYASLWGNVNEHVENSALWLIENKMNRSFDYTTVHKRSLEGGCNKVLSGLSTVVDFPANQLAMDHPAWQGSLHQFHPICQMPASFALATQTLRFHSNSKIFVAYDGRGSIDDYLAINATFSHELDTNLFPAMASTNDRKFLDMFMGMHGSFFIANPYSTFSLQIYIIRECLGLESVPVMESRDIYFKAELGNHLFWVGWKSLREAVPRILQRIHSSSKKIR